MDEEIPDHWTCSDNLWDASHASCDVPQELPDNEIDEILLAQVGLTVLLRGRSCLLAAILTEVPVGCMAPTSCWVTFGAYSLVISS